MFGSGRRFSTGDLDRICKGKRYPGADPYTRDEPDYDKLMNWRLGILKEHGLGLKLVMQIVKAHRGTVSFSGSTPHGLEVRISLPTQPLIS